jgi:hypothetical protein
MPSPKKSASGRGRKKAQKIEPLAFGPVNSETGLGWESFLEILANLLETEPSFLTQHTFEWRWVKPANSLWLPLRTDAAYSSLIKQLKAPRRNVSGKFIIIHMAEPVKKPVNPGMVRSSIPVMIDVKYLARSYSLGLLRELALVLLLGHLMSTMSQVMKMAARKRR